MPPIYIYIYTICKSRTKYTLHHAFYFELFFFYFLYLYVFFHHLFNPFYFASHSIAREWIFFVLRYNSIKLKLTNINFLFLYRAFLASSSSYFTRETQLSVNHTPQHSLSYMNIHNRRSTTDPWLINCLLNPG